MQASGLIRGVLILVIVLLLVMIGGMVALGLAIRDTAQTAMAPIQQANEQIGQIRTQVSEFMNPTPTIIPDPITIVREVRSLARLETIQYNVEKVITAETGQGRFAVLFGDRLLFVAHGTVIAGVDLAQVDTDDIWWEGDVLHVRLPEAEVFVATLDNDVSYVYDRDTGLLARGEMDLETQARRAAEEEILKAALEDQILLQAWQNAELFLGQFLRSLGHADVVFESSPAP